MQLSLPSLYMRNGKDKAVPVHAMRAYKGSRGIAPLVLTSTLDGGERSISHSDSFTLGKERRYQFNRRFVESELVWTFRQRIKSLFAEYSGCPNCTLRSLATLSPTYVTELLLQPSTYVTELLLQPTNNIALYSDEQLSCKM